MRKIAILAIFVVFAGVSCGVNQNPPSYVKDVAAYKEGSDGLVVYFILADSSGSMTTANGSVTIKIIEEISTGRERELYSRTRNVSTTDFHKTKIGRGAFERDAILYSFGRLTYSSFVLKPNESMGKIKIEFTSNGKTMNGEDTIFW